MGVHNVVIAVKPEIGNNSAASVATQLMNDFKSMFLNDCKSRIYSYLIVARQLLLFKIQRDRV
jgi:hypothetical protein